MRVALVHDYLKEFGGAERVLEALHEIFPKAPIFTAFYDQKLLGEGGKRFNPSADGWNIRSSWLQKIPFANKLISPFRIFAPMIFEGFDLSEYDLVISSCAIYFAKAVIIKPEALHISYIHTPPRYLYGYTTSFNYKKRWWTKIAGEIMNHFLRIYDFETSQRPDILVANSKNIQERIRKFYRRESVVIYPPVTLLSFPRKRESINKKFNGSRIKYGMTKDAYFLSVGRLVRGKGIEVIIEACGKLGLPLKIVGSGPELDELKRITHNSSRITKIEFLGQVSDEELAKLYANAKATIVASEDEDFGIVPVESMACGTPVIAPKAGGFLETVVDGKTGVLYGGPGMVDVESLIDGIKRFNDLNHFSREDLRKNAEKFSKERFKREILELIERNLK